MSSELSSHKWEDHRINSNEITWTAVDQKLVVEVSDRIARTVLEQHSCADGWDQFGVANKLLLISPSKLNAYPNAAKI